MQYGKLKIVNTAQLLLNELSEEDEFPNTFKSYKIRQK